MKTTNGNLYGRKLKIYIDDSIFRSENEADMAL